jgi:hypothetical protein
MSKGFIKVPTDIIRNESVNISSGDFALYVRLCYLHFKSYHNPELKVDHKKLMINVGITDARTLKKRLKSLYENKLILNEITKLPKRGEVCILFNDKLVTESKVFTMMNFCVFNYIGSINEHALRLIFFYKSYINKKKVDYDGEEKVKDYCFVGVETIKHQLKMGSSTILEANKLLTDNKLMKIKRQVLKTEYEYDENDELVYDRYHNHYHVDPMLF